MAKVDKTTYARVTGQVFLKSLTETKEAKNYHLLSQAIMTDMNLNAMNHDEKHPLEMYSISLTSTSYRQWIILFKSLRAHGRYIGKKDNYEELLERATFCSNKLLPHILYNFAYFTLGKLKADELLGKINMYEQAKSDRRRIAPSMGGQTIDTTVLNKMNMKQGEQVLATTRHDGNGLDIERIPIESTLMTPNYVQVVAITDKDGKILDSIPLQPTE